MGDDYDDAAGRFEDYIPEDLNEQQQIKDYIEDESTAVDPDPHNAVDRRERFVDEVSRRIADSRGHETPDGDTKFYDPDSGRWRDEGGLFDSIPEDRR